jgi:cellulose synthase/poly-beta-1,6-N-acetylglucosamine synthase-like glycosyltransferase
LQKTALPIDENRFAVSIVIPFRNEDASLPKLLESLLALKRVYDDEIILVNDGSNNLVGLPDLSKYPFIRLIHLETQLQGSKKNALTHGIRHSKNAFILTTDADCKHHIDWIETMAAEMNDSVNLVFGPVIVKPSPNNFVGRISFFESLSLSAVGVASSAVNVPILCSGANLLFRKHIWETIGGYEKHKNIQSGDDVLFMKDIDDAFPETIRATIHPRAVVETLAQKSISSFVQQHKRWASKTGHINTPVKKIWSFLLVWWMISIIPLFFISPIAAGILLQLELLFMLPYSYALGKSLPILNWLLFRLVYPFSVILIFLPFKYSWKK